jgi:hypothetical protein
MVDEIFTHKMSGELNSKRRNQQTIPGEVYDRILVEMKKQRSRITYARKRGMDLVRGKTHTFIVDLSYGS